VSAEPRLSQHIDLIGRRMAACRLNCDGIALDPARGILPRSLRLEHDRRTGARGSVALGINPGQGDDEEQDFYLQHGGTYDAMLEFWDTRRRFSHPYMTKTRRLIDSMGLDGPILWTELVKCQNPLGVKRVPPLSTIRTCVHLYLMQEMTLVPTDWPVVALGRESFRLAAVMFPSRTVIGVPHPTGSYGHFPALFDRHGAMKPLAEQMAAEALSAPMPVAAWIAVPRHESDA